VEVGGLISRKIPLGIAERAKMISNEAEFPSLTISRTSPSNDTREFWDVIAMANLLFVSTKI
jgi:hypothetical protein